MDNKERITQIYRDLDRAYFIDEHKEHAHLDRALPIGHGQTISQPSLVLEMTIALDIHKDHRVLEIGTGSGFQTALLAKAAEKVYTVERIKEHHESAKKRLEEASYENISYKLGDGSQGWPEHAPYDRIMVTAAAKTLPEALVKQLTPTGKMVIPVGAETMQELLLIEKNKEGKIKKERLNIVQFVDLIGDY
ncbi:MAG: protein-L-isoaspartate(D-aspartate) O-methyltransferase [Atopostipes suicloacalis]|nr:protein-L-isoaspartate(D-aspartate) O-methyltransferase [Atopostipes suicloacalis]